MAFKNKYRIVTDSYAGFEVQIKRWWFPIWIQKGSTNTFSDLDSARHYAVYGDTIEEWYR